MNPELRSLGRRCGANRLLGLIAILLLLAGPIADGTAATAEPPNFLTFQSFLTDENNVPIGSGTTVNKKIKFTIRAEDSVSGEVKWDEEQIVTVADGHFSVILGQGAEVTAGKHDLAAAFSGANAGDSYIEIIVSDTDGSNAQTITPRLRMLTSPYAFRAREANKLVGSGGADLIANNGSTTTISSDATIAGAATISGVTTLEGNLVHSGTSVTLKSTTVNGDAEVNGNAVFNGNVTIPYAADRKLLVSSLLHAADVQIDNNTILGNGPSKTVTAKGPVTAENDLTVEGGITAEGNITQTGGTANLKATSVTGELSVTNSENGMIHLTRTGEAPEKHAYIRLGNAGGLVLRAGIGGEGSGVDDKIYFEQPAVAQRGATIEGNVQLWSSTFTSKLFGSNDRQRGLILYGGTLDGDDRRNHIEMFDYSADNWGFRTSNGGEQSANDWLGITYRGSVRMALANNFGDWTINSDRRLKTDIEPIADDILGKLKKISAYRFRFKEQPHTPRKSIGVIAQEVREVFPELVFGKETDDDNLRVAYSTMAPLAIAGVNALREETGRGMEELRRTNAKLAKENAALKKQFGDLLSRLQALEAKTK